MLKPEPETALSRLFFKLSMRLLAVRLPLLYKMSHVTWTDLSLSCSEIGTETGVMNDLSEHLKYAKCPHFFAPFL